jgi:DNA-binding NarL/FixJ family response regulator
MKRKLSMREREVVRLLLRGFSNKQIAAELYIVLRTVEFHIINIYKKLEIKDRYGLFALFQKR